MSRKNTPRSSLSGVTACILAGGLGTRLRSVVRDRSKVMACVHGRPFLTFLLDQLHDAGVTDVVLCTGYLGRKVQEELGISHRGVRLTYSQETVPLGTAGAVRLALPRIASETVMVMNGDSYCSADLNEFHARHKKQHYEATLLLTQVPDCSRYGRVQTSKAGRVLSFEEKGQHTGPGWINAGVYLFDRQLLESIAPDQPVSMERDILPVWIQRGVGSHQAPAARFLDIGTPESYAETEAFFAPLLRRSA